MPSHQFQSPKVKAVKVTSAHRKTKVHTVVPRENATKTPDPEQVRRRRDV